MRNGVLARDGKAIGQAGGDVMREVCVYGGEDGGVVWDGADA